MVKHHIDRRNYQQPVSDWIPILPGPSGSGGEGTHADKVSPGDRHTCARNPERFDNDNTSGSLGISVCTAYRDACSWSPPKANHLCQAR